MKSLIRKILLYFTFTASYEEEIESEMKKLEKRIRNLEGKIGELNAKLPKSRGE